MSVCGCECVRLFVNTITLGPYRCEIFMGAIMVKRSGYSDEFEKFHFDFPMHCGAGGYVLVELVQ